MNKKLIFVIFIAIALVLGACFSPWKDDEGIFSISIGGESRAAAWNDTEILAKLTHTITLSDGPGPEQIQENVKYGSTVNFSVIPGRWTITITAFLNGEKYAAGSEIVTIKPGRNGAIPIKMSPVTSGEPGGPGESYNFTIEFKDEEINIPDISETIPKGSPITITVAGSYASYQWYIDGIALTENPIEGIQYGLPEPETLILYVLPSGQHRVTVVVIKDDVPYSKIVEFTVGE
jgi:hypothetical protein